MYRQLMSLDLQTFDIKIWLFSRIIMETMIKMTQKDLAYIYFVIFTNVLLMKYQSFVSFYLIFPGKKHWGW